MSLYGNRGVHGQTVDTIARRVLSGELPEGATLDLTAMQAELGVSLTALRESLKVLTAKGLVDARQKRGTFVRPRSDWNLLDPDVLRWQFSKASTRSAASSNRPRSGWPRSGAPTRISPVSTRPSPRCRRLMTHAARSTPTLRSTVRCSSRPITNFSSVCRRCSNPRSPHVTSWSMGARTRRTTRCPATRQFSTACERGTPGQPRRPCEPCWTRRSATRSDCARERTAGEDHEGRDLPRSAALAVLPH